MNSESVKLLWSKTKSRPMFKGFNFQLRTPRATQPDKRKNRPWNVSRRKATTCSMCKIKPRNGTSAICFWCATRNKKKNGAIV